MSRGKARGADGLAIDLIKDAGDVSTRLTCNTFYQMLANPFHTK